MNGGFWPPELVQALSQRRGVVFLGSGAAASSQTAEGVRQPTWESLLLDLASGLDGGDRAAFDALMGRGRLLDAAQIVVDVVPATKQQETLLDHFANGHIQPSDLYECVNLIDQPVVMTTNYDRLFERYWESLFQGAVKGPRAPLMVSTYKDNDVVDHLRSDRRLLLKLHGSIEKPRDIVLSRSQYSAAKYGYANFYQVASALILTRTVFFVGSGFNGDPDIDLLLEDAAFTARSIAPHYALVPKGRHTSEIESLRTGFNIHLIEYENASGDHSEVIPRLKELAGLVEDGRGLN